MFLPLPGPDRPALLTLVAAPAMFVPSDVHRSRKLLSLFVYEDVQSIERSLSLFVKCRIQVARNDSLGVGIPAVAIHQQDAPPAGDKLGQLGQIGSGHLWLQDATIKQIG